MNSATFNVFLFVSISFGMVMGAYTTTIDYRIRNRLPLVTKDCYCPNCNHVLPLLHQVPVLSWIFLGGKCGFCRKKIPVRYPLTEGGYTLVYAVVFCIFRHYPAVYLVLWFVFSCGVLAVRGHKSPKHLAVGILHMFIYHGIIAAVILFYSYK